MNPNIYRSFINVRVINEYIYQQLRLIKQVVVNEPVIGDHEIINLLLKSIICNCWIRIVTVTKSVVKVKLYALFQLLLTFKWFCDSLILLGCVNVCISAKSNECECLNWCDAEVESRKSGEHVNTWAILSLDSSKRKWAGIYQQLFTEDWKFCGAFNQNTVGASKLSCLLCCYFCRTVCIACSFSLRSP